MAAENDGARLFVAAYPCLAVPRCGGPDIERLLQDVSVPTKDFLVLPLATDLEPKFERGGIKREDMRFYNNMHLSKHGHQVVAKELVRLLGGVQ
jgi:hypothetical protein